MLFIHANAKSDENHTGSWETALRAVLAELLPVRAADEGQDKTNFDLFTQGVQQYLHIGALTWTRTDRIAGLVLISRAIGVDSLSEEVSRKDSFDEPVRLSFWEGSDRLEIRTSNGVRLIVARSLSSKEVYIAVDFGNASDLAIMDKVMLVTPGLVWSEG